MTDVDERRDAFEHYVKEFAGQTFHCREVRLLRLARAARTPLWYQVFEDLKLRGIVQSVAGRCGGTIYRMVDATEARRLFARPVKRVQTGRCFECGEFIRLLRKHALAPHGECPGSGQRLIQYAVVEIGDDE